MIDTTLTPITPIGMLRVGTVEAGFGPVPVARSMKDELEASDCAARGKRLAEEHFDFIWRLLRRFGVGLVEADDATQQVFLIALAKLSEIKRGSERSYLFGVALRVAADARRKTRALTALRDQKSIWPSNRTMSRRPIPFLTDSAPANYSSAPLTA